MHNPDHGPVRVSLLLFPFYRWETRTPVSWTKGKKTQNLKDLCLKTSSAAAAKSLQSCPTLCDPIDGSPPGSLSLGFSRQEHWSGLPFPSPVHEKEKWKWSRSVISNSSRPHGLQPTRLLHGIFQERVLEWGAVDQNHSCFSWTVNCYVLYFYAWRRNMAVIVRSGL